MNVATHETLTTKLKLLNTATPRKGSLPIFNCILLEPLAEETRMTAGNGEHFVQTDAPPIEGLTRPVAVQADLLSRTLNMIEGDYRLRIEGGQIGGHLVIETDGGRFSSVVFDGEEYLPYLPEGDFEPFFEMDPQQADWALRELEHVLNEQDFRDFCRHAVFLPQKGGYTMYATQGNILLSKRLHVQVYNPLRLLVPAAIVKLLRSAIAHAQTVQFGRIGGRLACKVGDYRFIYPDLNFQDVPFQQVLDALEVQATALAPVEPLMASLKRLARFNTMNFVDLAVTPEGLTLQASEADGSQARESLSDVQTDGHATLRLNARFLLAVLSAVESTHVQLEFGHSTQPLRVTGDEGRTQAAIAPVFT